MRNIRYIFKCKSKDYLKWIWFLIGITILYLNLKIELSRQFRATECTCKPENVFNIPENVTVKNFKEQSTESSVTTAATPIKMQNKFKKEKEIEKKEGELADFNYPLNVDMVKLVKDVKSERKVFHKPINTFKNKVIKNCDKKCNLESNASELILFVVKSAAQNLERRRVIRETWGKELIIDEFIIRRIFVVGLSKTKAVESNTNMECKRYNDVVQYDFYDDYYNNTLKAIGAMNWITTYCKQATFVLFVDDDYFVSPENLVKNLKQLSKEEVKHLFMGNVYRIPSPVRNPKLKWYVSRLEYPFKNYPSFINAGSYVMSLDVITDMQIAIQYTQLFRLDDVYLGIVAHKLKIELLGNNEFRVKKIKPSEKGFINVITSHGFKDTYQLRRVWRIYNEIRKVNKT